MRKIWLIVLLLPCTLFAQVAITGPLGYTVQLDTLRGYFGFGSTNCGRLSFDYNSPWAGRESSHLNMLINDSLYTQASWLVSCPAELLCDYLAGWERTDSSLTISWRVNELNISLTLQLVFINYMPGTFIIIKAVNERAEAVNCGFLLNLDALIGTNDSPDFIVDSVPYSSGKVFTGDEIPEEVIFSGSDPGECIVQTLFRQLEPPPSLLAIGRQSVFAGTCWELDPRFIEALPFSDIGFLIRWDPYEIPPGDSLVVGYFHGLLTEGDDSPVVWWYAPPSFYPEDCRLLPNPFEICLRLTPNFDRSLDSLSLCLDGLHEWLYLSADSACRDFVAISPYDTLPACWRVAFMTDFVTSMVTLPFNGSILAYPTDLHGRTMSGNFSGNVTLPGFPPINPSALAIGPTGIISCRENVVCEFRIIPRRNIDPTSPIIEVNGVAYTYDDGITVSGDTISFAIPELFLYHGNTVVCELVSLRDEYGCPLRESDTTFAWFTLDFFPPVVLPLAPSAGDTITDSTLSDTAFTIDFLISDGPAGVNRDSVSILVEFDDSSRLFPITSPYLRFAEDTLKLRFALAFPALPADVESIRVTISALQDLASACGPNIAEPFSLLLYYSSTTGISQVSLPEEFSLRIFPNPFNRSVKFLVESPHQARYMLSIYDICGHRLFKGSIEFNSPGRRDLIWQPSGLTSGLYYYKLESKTLVRQGKIIYLK